MSESTLGIGILCHNKQEGNQLIQYLSHYYPQTKPQPVEVSPAQQPSQPTTAAPPKQHPIRLTIKTKYYTATPSIQVITWDDLGSLTYKDIECLLVLTKYDESSQQLIDQPLIKDSLQPTIHKYNPTSYALVIDCKEDAEVSTEELFGNMELFVEVVYEDFGRLKTVGQMPKLPKSLMEDANGITRIVMLLQSTTWKHMTFKQEHKKQPTVSKVSTISSGEQKTVDFPEDKESPKPVPSKKDEQEECLKIQRQMDEFANIMTEMCNIRNTPLSDQDRRRRAEEVLMKLMQGLGDDDGEEL